MEKTVSTGLLVSTNFYVSDTGRATETVENIKNYNQNLKNQNESLKEYLENIKNHWQSDTEDRNSLITELGTTLDNVDSLAHIIDVFIDGLETFINSAENEKEN